MPLSMYYKGLVTVEARALGFTRSDGIFFPENSTAQASRCEWPHAGGQTSFASITV